MRWYYIPLLFIAAAAWGYVRGMFTALARNDWCKCRKKEQ